MPVRENAWTAKPVGAETLAVQQQRNSVDCAPFMLVRLMKIGYAVVKGTSAPGEKLGCPDLDRVRERLALLCHAPAEEWDTLFATPPRQI